MRFREVLSRLARKARREHRPVRSFEQDVRAAGGVGGGHDVGPRIVPVEKIVGSVGRWQNLRSDFFYRKGGVTQRFVRIGEAMKRGIDLPPIDVYKLKRPGRPGASPPSEYYVVDGHHRVAMARQLGQDFMDASVREFKVRPAPSSTPAEPPGPATEAADHDREAGPSK